MRSDVSCIYVCQMFYVLLYNEWFIKKKKKLMSELVVQTHEQGLTGQMQRAWEWSFGDKLEGFVAGWVVHLPGSPQKWKVKCQWRHQRASSQGALISQNS